VLGALISLRVLCVLFRQVKDHHMVTSPRAEAGLAEFSFMRWNARQMLKAFPIYRHLVPVNESELDDADVK
jgi:hypothetical protein